MEVLFMQVMIVFFFAQEIDRLLQSISWWLADQAFVLPQATTSLGCV